MKLTKDRAVTAVESMGVKILNCWTGEGYFLFVTAKGLENQLWAVSETQAQLSVPWQVTDTKKADGAVLLNLSMNSNNAALVRRYIRWAGPQALGSRGLSVGVIHPDAGGSKFLPVFKNRQIRPMFPDCTPSDIVKRGKNFLNVMDEAVWMVLRADYREGYGAAATGLSEEEDIVKALLYGYSCIGIDVSSKISKENIQADDKEIATKFAEFPVEFQAAVNASYLNAEFQVGKHKISFTEEEVHRTVLEYGQLIMYVQSVYNSYLKSTPWPIDFELAVLREERNLTPEEHYLLTNELERNGVRITNFLFDLQKGMSDEELQLHGEIANTFEYRLALTNADVEKNDFREFLKVSKGRGHFKVADSTAAEKLLQVF